MSEEQLAYLLRAVKRFDILHEIDRERERQIRELGYTAEHDRDAGGLSHLTGWVTTYAAESDRLAYRYKWYDVKDAEVRAQLLKTAALAVAAIEYLDHHGRD